MGTSGYMGLYGSSVSHSKYLCVILENLIVISLRQDTMSLIFQSILVGFVSWMIFAGWHLRNFNLLQWLQTINSQKNSEQSILIACVTLLVIPPAPIDVVDMFYMKKIISNLDQIVLALSHSYLRINWMKLHHLNGFRVENC